MEKDLVFNQAKLGSVFTFILSLALAFLCANIALEADSPFFWIPTFIALLGMIKSFLSIILAKPYIVLSDQAILIYPNTYKEREILWEDISGFRFEYLYFRRNLHIGLYDNAKYGFTKNSFMPGFTFIWARIKQKDRKKFMAEVNRRTKENVNTLQSLFEHEKERKREKQEFKLFYFLRAYLMSLLITLTLYMGDYFDHLSNALIYLLIFPFAKILYDRLGGFELFYRMDEERMPGRHDSLLFVLILIFYFLIYLLAPYLAGPGFLIFIYSQVRKKFDERDP